MKGWRLSLLPFLISNFYFLVGRWLAGRSLPPVRQGNAGGSLPAASASSEKQKAGEGLSTGSVWEKEEP